MGKSGDCHVIIEKSWGLSANNREGLDLDK